VARRSQLASRRDLGAAEGHGQAGETPARHLGHRGLEVAFGVAGDVEVAKQRPQPAHDVLGRTDRARRALGEGELGHLRRTEPIKVQITIDRARHEEQPRHVQVAGDRSGGEAALLDQVGPVVLLKLLSLGGGCDGCRCRHHAEPAQIPEHRRHRLRRQPQHVTLGASVREELVHPRW
jgi:hypothetical protein